ncbi:hypothetical protein ACMA5I_01035 [Paracoccaceae bacterium GXU_MW_L88]
MRALFVIGSLALAAFAQQAAADEPVTDGAAGPLPVFETAEAAWAAQEDAAIARGETAEDAARFSCLMKFLSDEEFVAFRSLVATKSGEEVNQAAVTTAENATESAAITACIPERVAQIEARN